MRLLSLDATNVLSFGGTLEQPGLRCTFDRDLTVLVGPNGGGKSNVLQALTLILGVFSTRQIPSWGPRWSDARHQPTAPDAPMRLSLTLEWDTAAERAKWQAWLMAAVTPAVLSTPQIPPQTYWSKVHFQTLLDAVAEWDWNPLLDRLVQQRLVLTVQPLMRTFRLTCEFPDLKLTQEIGNIHRLYRWDDTPRSTIPFFAWWQTTWSQAVREQWDAFLMNAASFPSLPPLDPTLFESLPQDQALDWVPVAPNSREWARDTRWPTSLLPLFEEAESPETVDWSDWHWGVMLAALLRPRYYRSRA